MKRYNFPSFGGLKAFFAVCATGSVTGAADSLGVSPSSVSHQVKSFERELGVRLFENVKGRLRPTVIGEQFFDAIEEPMLRLQEATGDVRSLPGCRRISLTLTPSFAASWLMPRLQDLTAHHPDIELNLITTTRVVDLLRENVDLAIRRGAGPWEGCVSEPLLTETVLPVLSPEIWASCGSSNADDVLRTVRILENTTLPEEWDRWTTSHNLKRPPARNRFKLETYELTIQAARDGLGIALGRRPLVDGLIDSGELVVPFAASEAEEVTYQLVRRDVDAASDVKRLLNWLRSHRD